MVEYLVEASVRQSGFAAQRMKRNEMKEMLERLSGQCKEGK